MQCVHSWDTLYAQLETATIQYEVPSVYQLLRVFLVNNWLHHELHEGSYIISDLINTSTCSIHPSKTPQSSYRLYITDKIPVQ